MKVVQDSLALTGIPAYAQMWQATEDHPQPPKQYLAYSYMLRPDAFQDDVHTQYVIYLYLNLWTDDDPTESIDKVRRAMFSTGWDMDEETTKGYKQPAYNEMIDRYCVIWTWVYREDVPPGGV